MGFIASLGSALFLLLLLYVRYGCLFPNHALLVRHRAEECVPAHCRQVGAQSRRREHARHRANLFQRHIRNFHVHNQITREKNWGRGRIYPFGEGSFPVLW